MHDWHGQSAQAKRAVAFRAVEMRVEIVYVARTFIAANGVFQRAASVVDAVDQMVGKEEREGARYGRLVDCHEQICQVEQRYGSLLTHHRAQYEHTHGRGLDVAQRQFSK